MSTSIPADPSIFRADALDDTPPDAFWGAFVFTKGSTLMTAAKTANQTKSETDSICFSDNEKPLSLVSPSEELSFN